ncbi:MAG: serine protease [Lachnospiraceae bacterium]|nr:serine protease [Lachnospiraceae bacterium]
MPDSEDREFIREKIMNKAAGRRYRIWKVCRLVAGAIIFGLVASLFFVLGVKYLEPRFLPEETQPTETISMGRDPEESAADTETLPEETAEQDVPEESGGQAPSDSAPAGESTEETSEGETETAQEESSESETTPVSPEEYISQAVEEAVDSAVLEALRAQEEYLALGWYRQVGDLMKSVNRGLVTVSSVTQDTDWFNNPVSSANQSSGAVVCVTDAEVLILADYAALREAEMLTVSFASGKPVEARIKKYDGITGIAIVSVSCGAVPEGILEGIGALTLGNSYQVTGGMPVVAAGSPAGCTGSVATGMVSLVQKNVVGTDTAFQLLYSNILLAENGGGFLFNMDGELIGVLTRDYGDETVGYPMAIGISCLKGIIEKLSSGIDAAYLGIQGQNATADIAEAYDMPPGIYVTRVIVDSPAYLAGLKAGDIIVASGENDLMTMQSLQRFLENYSTEDVIALTVYRGGQDEYVEMSFEVTLGAR